jgi:hypothetical protein
MECYSINFLFLQQLLLCFQTCKVLFLLLYLYVRTYAIQTFSVEIYSLSKQYQVEGLQGLRPSLKDRWIS